MEGTTITREVKSNPQDRIQVEIGDSKQPDFKPQFKVSRWDNEVNFSMRAEEEAGATMVEEDGKVKYKGRDIEVHQYEKPDAGEDGGFEFEWVLNKKPKSNVLRTTIQHKGLDFFYQPALTVEEIEQRMSRDENVVGSYAVYHKTKKNNTVGGNEYKTGKAFHIYRPHAIDANGVKVWCDLNITEGELTVTVPNDFLNTASYPVVVDPTIGYTSAGSSSYSLASGNANTALRTSDRKGGEYTASENGTLDSISAYTTSSTSNSFDLYMAVNQKDSVSAGQHGNIAKVTSNNVSHTTTPSWKTLSLAGESISTGVTYVISVAGNGSDLGASSFGFCRFDSSTNQLYETASNGASGFTNQTADTWVCSPFSDSVKISIYATYTASGGGANSGFLMFM